jgi:hypothetical protein
VTIDVLPDVALLQIFDFYMDEVWMGSWKNLVHVCRKWRNIAFGSPRRLDLRLYCKAGTPVRDTLDVWPPLPIFLCSRGHRQSGMDNIIAALEHNDRICQIDFLDFPEFNQFEFPNANNFLDPDFSAPFQLIIQKTFWQQWSSHFRPECRSFLIRSWVDLQQVCNTSG